MDIGTCSLSYFFTTLRIKFICKNFTEQHYYWAAGASWFTTCETSRHSGDEANSYHCLKHFVTGAEFLTWNTSVRCVASPCSAPPVSSFSVIPLLLSRDFLFFIFFVLSRVIVYSGRTRNKFFIFRLEKTYHTTTPPTFFLPRKLHGSVLISSVLV